MAKGKSLFLGFVVGGTISAVTTLLSTPSSGKDIRACVKEQGIEWKDMIANLKYDSLRLKNQIAETSKEGAVLIRNLTKEMKNSVEEWKIAVEPHQDNIHEYLEQIELSLKDLEEKIKST